MAGPGGAYQTLDQVFAGEDMPDGPDDQLPQPIYLSRRALLTQMGMATSHDAAPSDYSQDCEDSEDENEDDENYDLEAPPLESWYHGRISRQTATDRLEQIKGYGGYLVRESVGQPGDYAISYLSNTGQVHHFKINSNCGYYYIGGRKFLSLNDLIGFYTNCSCILENEALSIPIVPPQPVPLYMMLRATMPHTRASNDELSIEVGEIFLLMSQIDEEWGWGRSQASGQSGLIPIVIMEDVTNEDTNLGKLWFHDSVGREEAVELLLQKGVPGSFLVRSSARGAEDEIRYSMAVRTLDRVQRFLITRFSNGYYVFGGRPFNSMEDIIERYRNEFILDHLKLGAPLPKEPTTYLTRPLPASRITDPTNPDKQRSNSITRPDVPGDLTGTLSLRKGKKSPVYGKWKELYFVLQCKERKLLFYEQESKHRAKGLLDLRQCKVYEVHPSLFGPNVIVVMLKYLNELQFLYLTGYNIQTWLSTLRHCTQSSDVHPQKDLQYSRSLNVVVKDCKLAKSNAQVFGLVFIDGACVARSRVVAEVPCVFDEGFYFEELPRYTTEFAVEIHTLRRKSFVGRENLLGRMQVYFADLPCGQEDDRWHQLLQNNAKTPRGSLRLGALFKDLVILPVDEYAGLKELILSDDLKVIEALAKVCKDHHAELASTLVHIFCTYNRVVPLISACLAKSVDCEENVSTLFRASTLSTMLMDQFMKLTSSDYLRCILRTPIRQIAECPNSCEINPAYLPSGADPTPNQNLLENHLTSILSVIFASVEFCPQTLRYIFHSLQQKVAQKWKNDETVRIRVVSGFLFLRFICPALLKPQLFDLVTEMPNSTADRALKLVTKSVQNLANLVEFKTKESFMIYLNHFIKEHLPRMRHFVDQIAMMDNYPVSADLTSPNPAQDLATIFHLCNIYTESLQKLAYSEPEIGVLLDVMQSLKITERKYANKCR